MDLAVSYWRMGTIHILEGYDHLLFLLTLLLIVTGFVPLLKTVTAFTLAHSLTLALATLNKTGVNLPCLNNSPGLSPLPSAWCTGWVLRVHCTKSAYRKTPYRWRC